MNTQIKQGQEIPVEKVALSEKEVAERYPFTVAWLRRARWAGTSPPYIKVGHKVLYLIAELDRWVRSHGEQTGTQPVRVIASPKGVQFFYSREGQHE